MAATRHAAEVPRSNTFDFLPFLAVVENDVAFDLLYVDGQYTKGFKS